MRPSDRRTLSFSSWSTANEIRLHRLYHSNWRPSWRPRSTRPRSSHSGPLRRVVDHPTNECKSIDDEDKVSKNSDLEGAEMHVRTPSSVADKISSLVLRGQGVFARASLAQRSPGLPTFAQVNSSSQKTSQTQSTSRLHGIVAFNK